MSNCGCNRNPCRTSSSNTATCESLPSQIENFTLQFFGVVTKTEVDGKVTWVLPCDLMTGLPNNPRGSDEGLACYFKRLFEEGIIGLTGPQGDSGLDGANGFNAFTVTLASFTQPTLDAPSLQISTAYNPAILEGLTLFIEGSGYYTVDSATDTGILYLTLTKPVSGASGTISAGKLVVPAGYAGASVTGPTGPQGTQGPQGIPGESFTSENAMFQVNSGTQWFLPVISQAIHFTTSQPSVILPQTGTYLLSYKVELVGRPTVALNDVATIKLRNTSIGGDVPGSEAKANNIVEDQILSLTWTGLYTTDGPSKTVALFGDVTTASVVGVNAERTTFSYVRIA